MSEIIESLSPRLPDLDAPVLDLSGSESPEIMLSRLRAQNGALASLRAALANEERQPYRDVRVAA